MYQRFKIQSLLASDTCIELLASLGTIIWYQNTDLASFTIYEVYKNIHLVMNYEMPLRMHQRICHYNDINIKLGFIRLS